MSFCRHYGDLDGHRIIMEVMDVPPRRTLDMDESLQRTIGYLVRDE